MKVFTFVFVFSFLSGVVFAAPAPPEPFRQFYMIHEEAAPRHAGFEDPIQLASLRARLAAFIDLSRFDFYNQQLPQSPQPYDRDRHFGDWVNDPRDQNCYDTRAKVLIRDSRRQVTFRSNNHCVVDGGEWAEPYGGQVHQSAGKIQIDHVVALKNAFISGAWRWDWLHRCLYANFIGNNFHLVAADGRENMSKGDKTPADWMPSNRAGSCAHLARWLGVKLVWGLAMHAREAQAIQALLRERGCNPQDFKFPAEMLTQQRQAIAANLDLCQRLRPGF